MSSRNRQEKKSNEQGKQALKSIIDTFFTASMSLKKADDIKLFYKKSESAWMFYVHKVCKGDKAKVLKLADRFEAAIANAHIAVKKNKHNTPASTSLAMLRVLRHVQKTNRVKCFMREFPFWLHHTLTTYKKVRDAKHKEMINGYQPNQKIKSDAPKNLSSDGVHQAELKVTITERKVA